MAAQDRLKLIFDEYRRRLDKVLGDELDCLVLYGSQARGDAVEGSDIDVLCVMKRSFDYGGIDRKDIGDHGGTQP